MIKQNLSIHTHVKVVLTYVTDATVYPVVISICSNCCCVKKFHTQCIVTGKVCSHHKLKNLKPITNSIVLNCLNDHFKLFHIT